MNPGRKTKTELLTEVNLLRARIAELETVLAEKQSGQEKLLETIFQTTPDILYFYHAQQQRHLFINKELGDLLGYTSEEVKRGGADVLLKNIHPADLPLVLEHIGLLANTPEDRIFSLEYRIKNRAGQYLWFYVREQVFERDAEGKPEVLFGTVQNITERRQAEEAMQESERKYRLLFENMTAGFALHEMIYDEQGQPVDYRFLEINPAFERLTGLTAVDLAGKTVKEVLPAIEPYWIENYGKVAQTGKPLAFQNYSKAHGKHYDVWAFSPVPNQFAVVFMDVTERIEAEREVNLYREQLEKVVEQRTAELLLANEQLTVLSRIKDEFVSNVSHELRSPLTSLVLRHQLIRAAPHKLNEHLDVLVRETARLGHTIDDLLRLSRLDIERTEVVFKPTDLNLLMVNLVNDRTLQAQQKDLSLTVVEYPDLPLVMADAGLLEQVMSILLTNAINYTPPGGHITVSTLVKSPWIGFSVSDTGLGILPAERSRLFERFFKGTANRTAKVRGTGLGLAIAKEIVDIHKGRIEVESTGVPGEGSTFWVWLNSDPKFL